MCHLFDFSYGKYARGVLRTEAGNTVTRGWVSIVLSDRFSAHWWPPRKENGYCIAFDIETHASLGYTYFTRSPQQKN